MNRHLVLISAMLVVVVAGLVVYAVGVTTDAPSLTPLKVTDTAAPSTQGAALPSTVAPKAATTLLASGASTNWSVMRPAEQPRPYITSALGEKSKTPSQTNPAKALERKRLSDSEREAIKDRLRTEFEPVRKQMLAAYDANGDGVLDANEQQAGKKAELAKFEKLMVSVLPKYDVNRNGVLDPGEKAEMMRAGKEFQREAELKLLLKYDANRNGILDPEEKEAIYAMPAQLPGFAKPYDLNGDGKLDETERARLKSDFENRKPKGQ